MGAEWFRRLGDVPGLEYSPPLVVDRTTLPRYDDAPEIRRIKLEGDVREYLVWGMKPAADDPEAWMSMDSPAEEHMNEALREGQLGWDFWPTEPLLQRLYEALELPGEGQDYHRALAQVQNVLSTRKLAEPEVLDVLERLAWLDIRLLLAYPAAVMRGSPDDDQAFLGSGGFNALRQLYGGEGFLREALGVAELHDQFPTDDRWLTHFQARLETIRSEGTGKQ